MTWSSRHLIALFVFLIAAAHLQSEILVVDRDPANTAADHHGLQEALEAAAPNDIIYVTRSANRYEAANVTKPVTLIGAGRSSDDNLTILNELSITATNVFVTGFTFQEPVAVYAPSHGVTFFRNYFQDNISGSNGFLRAFATESPIASKITSLHVINNRFIADSSNEFMIDLFESDLAGRTGIETEVFDFVFANNILNGGIVMFPNVEGEIYNNYFDINDLRTAESYTGAFSGRVQSAGRIYNNIVQDMGESTSYLGSFTRLHNLFNTGSLATSEEARYASSDGNIPFTNLSAIILNSGSVLGESLTLIENSPAIGAGLNGEDIGIFGGLHPWNLNNLPPIPSITKVLAPRIVSANEGMTLTIEVQSNN